MKPFCKLSQSPLIAENNMLETLAGGSSRGVGWNTLEGRKFSFVWGDGSLQCAASGGTDAKE